MKINQFTKQNLKLIRESVNSALKDVNEEYGIELSLGNISFDEFTFRGKLNAQIKDPEVQAELKNEISKDLEYFGIKIGTTFKNGTKIFTVTGYNSHRWKNPVEIKDQNGRSFVTSVSNVKKLIQ